MTVEARADRYEDAKALVLALGKPSPSYVQRSLGIGYNEARHYIERMQAESLCTAPSRAGARRMLAPANSITPHVRARLEDELAVYLWSRDPSGPGSARTSWSDLPEAQRQDWRNLAAAALDFLQERTPCVM